MDVNRFVRFQKTSHKINKMQQKSTCTYGIVSLQTSLVALGI